MGTGCKYSVVPFQLSSANEEMEWVLGASIVRSHFNFHLLNESRNGNGDWVQVGVISACVL